MTGHKPPTLRKPMMPPQHCECGRELPCYQHKHTQDCINAFYSDGGQSGCICGADDET